MTDKIKINISAGGIFSKFMFGIQNAEFINSNVKRIYFHNLDQRAIAINSTKNPFDYVLKQEYDEHYLDISAIHLGNYSKFNPIESSNKLLSFKKISSTIKFSSELLELVQKYENLIKFDNNTIGVHIRLCDMNINHANDYGIINYEDYDAQIEKIISYENRIFVASDNNQSIDKLKNKYGDKVLFVPDLLRATTETEDTFLMQEKYLGSKQLWIESFLEMLLLCKCNTLICRTSNLANASIIFSKTLENIIRI